MPARIRELHRALRLVEHRRHLPVGVAAEVGELDGAALVDRQPGHRALDAVGDGAAGVSALATRGSGVIHVRARASEECVRSATARSTSREVKIPTSRL